MVSWVEPGPEGHCPVLGVQCPAREKGVIRPVVRKLTLETEGDPTEQRQTHTSSVCWAW